MNGIKGEICRIERSSWTYIITFEIDPKEECEFKIGEARLVQ